MAEEPSGHDGLVRFARGAEGRESEPAEDAEATTGTGDACAQVHFWAAHLNGREPKRSRMKEQVARLGGREMSGWMMEDGSGRREIASSSSPADQTPSRPATETQMRTSSWASPQFLGCDSLGQSKVEDKSRIAFRSEHTSISSSDSDRGPPPARSADLRRTKTEPLLKWTMVSKLVSVRAKRVKRKSNGCKRRQREQKAKGNMGEDREKDREGLEKCRGWVVRWRLTSAEKDEELKTCRKAEKRTSDKDTMGEARQD